MLKEVISAEQTHPLLLDSKMLERLRNMAAGMEESTKDTYERKGVDHFGIINKLQKTRYKLNDTRLDTMGINWGLLAQNSSQGMESVFEAYQKWMTEG